MIRREARTMRIVVAMSGGVDSSVAAGLLVEQGHDVIGLSMQLYDASDSDGGERSFGSCCSIDDLHDARRVAAAINIPHYILNFERQFNEQVVSNFVSEYAAGRTPLPCAHCNSDLKFATLLDRARGLGADAVATGHYARVERTAAGRYAAQARRRRLEGPVVLPLRADAGSARAGRLPRRRSRQGRGPRLGAPARPAGRGEARQPGDLLHPRPRLRRLRHPPRAGGGRPAARSWTSRARCWAGTAASTASPSASARVSASSSSPDREAAVRAGAQAGRTRTSSSGRRPRSSGRTLTASGVNWIDAAPDGPRRASVQIRHRHHAAPATVRSTGDGHAEVVFDTPQIAVTPGQAAVFYDGDVVLGGGWIDN